jgi:hypothetical protein
MSGAAAMLAALVIAVVVIVHLLALAMVPLGLPGTFVQVGAAVVVTALSGGTRLGWGWVLVLLALALAGELAELLAGTWGTRRYGGSRRAAWDALVGGVVGAVVGGIPIPFLGSIVMSFVGTFVGAWLGEASRTRRAAPSARVGLGALAGRTVGTAVKMFVALLIFLVSLSVLVAQMAGAGA